MRLFISKVVWILWFGLSVLVGCLYVMYRRIAPEDGHTFVIEDLTNDYIDNTIGEDVKDLGLY